MDESMKGQMGMQHPEGCRCGMCQGKMCGMCGMGGGCSGHGCWYHVIRWILGIAIIMIVFGLGIMIGELRGALESGSGYRMMRTPYYGQSYNGAYPMMQDQSNGYGYGNNMMGGRSQAQTVPSSPLINQ